MGDLGCWIWDERWRRRVLELEKFAFLNLARFCFFVVLFEMQKQ